MSTLLLRLAAPIQAWGAESKFERRVTLREPTKSGVIGLLAAALGRMRGECLNDLSALNFGVRIDQPGQLLRDFHTARPTGAKNPYVTERYYLMDAVFVVGLEGEPGFLCDLEKAIQSPFYPLYLGRRSCPPEGRITLGLRDEPLKQALAQESWQASNWYQKRELKRKNPQHLTLVLDSPEAGVLRRRDMPISFSQRHRKYMYRYISDLPNTVDIKDINPVVKTEHDPFEGLEA